MITSVFEAKDIFRGAVIDVNLDPTVGAEKGKTRPCIVVTSNVVNRRVPVVQVVPITSWSEKKARVVTNVELMSSTRNGLTKRSIADTLQTRPIDYRQRLVKVRGRLAEADLSKIDRALKKIFALD